MTEVPPDVPGDTSHRRMWGWWAVVGALVVVIVIVGGLVYGFRSRSTVKPVIVFGLGKSSSLATTTTLHARGTGTGYMTTRTNEVVFLQWKQKGDFVSGSEHDVVLSEQAPPPFSGQSPLPTTQSNTYSLNGTIKGNSVALNFEQVSGPDFGQLNGGRLTINFPQDQGGLVPVTFVSASVNDFDAAVADLQRQAIRAIVQERAAAWKIKQKQAIDADVRSVDGDLASLSTHSDQKDVASVTLAVKRTGDDLARIQTESQKVITEAQQPPDGNFGQVCADAASVSADVDSIGRGDFDAVTVDVSTTQKMIVGLLADFAKLLNDQALFGLSSFQPPNAPTQAQVAQAIDDAKTAVASVISTVNGQIDTVNEDVAAAFNAGNSAKSAGNCGSPSSPPQPIPHLS
jgi:hypothetical protein